MTEKHEAAETEERLIVELDEVEETTSPAAGALVVELDEGDALPGLSAAPSAALDLTAVELTDAPKTLPGFTGKALPVKGKATMAARNVLTMAVAGFLGGLLGWLLTDTTLMTISTAGEAVLEVALYAALVGAAIGLALGLAHGVLVAATEKALRGALWGVLFGAVGGALGGGVAQAIYGSISEHYVLSPLGQVLLRAVGWSLMGLFFGLGQGALVTAAPKMRNGILGGALGGLLGGAVLQGILFSMGQGWFGRGLALSVMGCAIGLLIGLVEEAAKEAWLRIIGGPLTGKQFIIYEERTVIGSSPKAAIMLIKDPQVAAEHAVIERDGNEFVLAQADPSAVVLVNDHPVTRRLLEDGDVLGIGASRLEFRTRTKGPSGKDGGKQSVL